MILRICAGLLAAMAAHAQMPGYGGPGVATRGGRGAGNRGTEPVNIRPYVGVQAIADNGLTVVGLNQQGEIVNPGTLYGVEAVVGAYGTKAWKRNQLGMDYQGTYRHYSNNSFYNGSDHMLGLSYSSQVSRRVALQFSTVAGTTSRTTGGTLGIGLLDSTYLGTPLNDVFDNRAFFIDGSGGASIQIGSRNFITVGGSGFAVRRQSKALVGINGHRAFGSVGRQLGRSTALGLSYQYMHIDYPRVFGEADVMTLMATWTRRIGRAWGVSLGVGAFRTDFAGVRQVAVDPVVAELFGTTTGRAAFNSIFTTSAFSANINRNMRRGSVGVGYNRGANPGNGALLLNRNESLNVSYSYNTGYQWSFSTVLSLNRYQGLGIYSDKLSSYNGSIMASRKLTDDFHFTGGVDLRQYQTGQSQFNRLSTRVMAGISYSPGSIPLSIR